MDTGWDGLVELDAGAFFDRLEELVDQFGFHDVFELLVNGRKVGEIVCEDFAVRSALDGISGWELVVNELTESGDRFSLIETFLSLSPWEAASRDAHKILPEGR